MSFRILPLLLFAALLTGCISNQRSSASPLVNDPNTDALTSDQVDNPLDLTGYLQRIAGVAIIGNGSGAQVRIRGPISFSSGQGPLFVIDGSKFGFDYGRLYNAINVREISRVRVLKNASETAFYGTQGAGGVILITLRKT